MTTFLNAISRIAGELRLTVAVIVSAVFFAGCAATGSKPQTSKRPTPTALIEVQDDVGFTITDVVKVSGDVRVGYAEAVELLESGQDARGISVLESLIEQAPGLAAARIDLGIAYHRTGDLGQAERTLTEALELSPDHPIVLNELGIVYRKTGRFDEARSSYESALAIFPGYHYARRNLAVLCDLYLADDGCARENYEAYMAAVVEDPDAERWLAALRLRQGGTL